MKMTDALLWRMLHQHITAPSHVTAHEVVHSMVAMQAQDYLASLWAIGLRTKTATEENIERAIADKKIIRTWPMRGTLHYVGAEDVRWMLKLLTPPVLTRSAALFRQEELTERILSKSAKLLTKALQENQSLTRDALYTILNKAKISTQGQRGMHIIGYLAQQGILCFGPRQGKQHTFVLLDEWLPHSRALDREEALAELALRYFKSHGPATANDLMTWSGLNENDIKTSIEMVKSELIQVTIQGQTYWSQKDIAASIKKTNAIHLLPAFDEFLKGYNAKSIMLDSQHTAKVILKNGIFNPIIIQDGQVLGTWKRTLFKDKVVVEINPFSKLTKTHHRRIIDAAKHYSLFLSRELEIIN